MSGKSHSQSNVQTEDSQLEEREINVHTLLEDNPPIVDVWAHNFAQQLTSLTQLAQIYPIAAVDTEFPGNIYPKHSLSQYYHPQQIDYQVVWHNVEQTKLIQVGITLSDAQGKTPPKHCTWQFHLQFNLQKDNQALQSIQLLQQAGIDFAKLRTQGIPQTIFAQAFMSSGLILNKNIRWVVFHGSHDFGYLLRLLRAQPLPKNAEEFYKCLKIYFPTIYDLKHIVGEEEEFMKKGLNAIAETLGCARVGPKHQAGSDSLLTLRSFFQLKSLLGDIHFQERSNTVFGIAQTQSYVGYGQTYTYNPGYLNQFSPLYSYLQYNNNSFQKGFYHNDEYQPQ